MFKKTVSALLAVAMAATALAGCSGDAGSSQGGTESQSGSQGSDSKYADFLTIDVFDSYANYQGIQGGWYGEIIKEKFNMELNIIAPNVAGGGDTLFQTRSAAGNIGDIILTTAQGERLQDLVTAGLIADMTPYITDEHESFKTYEEAIAYTSENMVEEDGIWCVPSEVSTRAATDSLGGTDPNGAAYIRWDLYKELGYPEIGTMEDLLDVMEDMQKLCPTSDSGQKVYAFSLFKDWDDAGMSNVSHLSAFYGYDSLGFVSYKADGSGEIEDMLQDDSMYLRGIRFYNEAYRRGLVDPESTTQNYDTLVGKYQDGAVLYSPFPWLGASAYNTDAHTSEGKGFMMAEDKDETVRQWGCYSKGNTEIVAMVGSKAQDPQRMVDFINWLYSTEGIACSMNRYCGPEGVLWTMEDGQPVLTELGEQCFIEGDGTMPEEYGGGSWLEGSSKLEYKIISAGELNPETGFPYDPGLWDSYAKLNTNPVIEDWQAHMDAKNAIDYLQKNDQLMTSPGISFASPSDDTEIATLRAQCKSVLVENSWKAVFADSEEDCERYIQEMISTVKGLGYDDIVAVDKENAQLKRDAWSEAAAE